MAITFLQAKKRQRYLILILALLVFAAFIIAWQGFSKRGGEEPTPLPITPELSKIKINFDILRKPLTVVLPDFSAELTASSTLVAPAKSVDLTVNIAGITDSVPLTYQFDCTNDRVYEKVVENISGKTYTAFGLCQYKEEGVYFARVLIEGEFKYFVNQGEEKTEKKSAEASVQITVKKPNLNPVISFCDVNLAEGSTLSDFKFIFTVSASDPDKDEIAYLWNFGDGTFENIPSPSHQYKKPGGYFPFVQVFDLVQGAKKGGEAICYPASLVFLKDYQHFEEIPAFAGEIGRKNPFIPY